MSIDFDDIHATSVTASGVLVKIRSRMLFFRVGNGLTRVTSSAATISNCSVPKVTFSNSIPSRNAKGTPPPRLLDGRSFPMML